MTKSKIEKRFNVAARYASAVCLMRPSPKRDREIVSRLRNAPGCSAVLPSGEALNSSSRSRFFARFDCCAKIKTPTGNSLLSCRAFQVLVGVFVALLLSTQSGCQIFRKFGGEQTRIPVQFEQPPSQVQLLESLAARTAKIKQLDSRVAVKLAGVPTKIKGTLQVEFPNRMRMKAGVMGASEMGVDVGSNEQEFWIWSKVALPRQPPALYHANHAAFQQSPIRQTIPLDPKWLIEAIGMVQFSPTDVHYGPQLDAEGRMKLYTVHQTASGPVTRATLLSASSGLVEQQAIYDSKNRLIAYSNSTQYKNYPEYQISLPHRIELFMIQPDGQEMKMGIDLGAYSIDSLYGNANRMWAMPDPEGVSKIDLTKMSNPIVIPRTGNRFTPQ
ncbi:MAG: hypothetical protein P8J27_16020 [Mariniblastus sp.]|nr:hypothetical protein [Mariniblastus sp.]